MAKQGKIKKAIEGINQAILNVLLDFGDEVFEECQNLVPVRTGNLKRSGSIQKFGKGRATHSGTEGFNIMYTAPYAHDVHEGFHGNPSFRHNADVRSYIRRSPSGRMVRVRRHNRTHVGNKPMYDTGTDRWYAKDMSQSRQANPWINQAYENTLRNQPKWLRKLLPSAVKFVDKSESEKGQIIKGTE